MRTRFDTIIIGTGQSGPSLAARLAGTGRRVAIIERKRIGGTCVNTGCMPTKTLVASAYAAHLAHHAADYGVMIGGPVRVDMMRVKARKDAVAENASRGVETWLKGIANLTVFEGHARFESPSTVRVNGDVLEAEQIFVNVGGRALVPAMPGLDQIGYLTNSSMMEIDYLPEHLIIIGGSYIGLEFGQMYRRFGAHVTIIEKGPRVIAREDDDVSEGVLTILRNEGVKVEVGAECMSAGKRDGKIAVKLDCAGGARDVVGSHLLLAVGRVPNTDDLGLAHAGVQTDARGYIEVDDELRTHSFRPRVFAAAIDVPWV